MIQLNTSKTGVFSMKTNSSFDQCFVNRHFEEFFCTHAPLIENHFQKIMAAAEANIHDRNAVAPALLEVRSQNDVFQCFVSSSSRNYSFFEMIFTRYTHVLVYFIQHGIC